MMLATLAGKLWDKTIDCIPFFLLAKDSGSMEMRLNLNRIIEAVLIAVITAAIIGWTVKSDIDNLKKDVTDVKAQVNQIYKDIYIPEIRNRP